MPLTSKQFLTGRYRTTGTRFRVYPQLRRLRGFGGSVVVYVNARPGTIQAGPRDDRIYVLDAPAKAPYQTSKKWPPYTGRVLGAAAPDPNGHFDHIRPADKAFASATAFATVRCVLDVWEEYLGRRLPWYFRDTYPRLEVIARIKADDAYSDYGYLEFGFDDADDPLCLDFDAVAHEVGHLILKSVIGNPPPPKRVEFRAHEEASADLVAIVAALHFESVVDRVLERTRGMLFATTGLSRVAESLADRNAFNNATMATVPWSPEPITYKYALSRVFAGAAFDILVGIYEDRLVRRGAIPRTLADRASGTRRRGIRALKRRFAFHFRRRREEFKSALVYARDYFGRLMARTWDTTPMTDLSYVKVVGNMIAADEQLSGGRHRRLIRTSFERRLVLPRTPG